MSNQIWQKKLTMGGDPELFVETEEGKIINAENLVVPKNRKSEGERIFADGIAVEINPAPSFCRELLAANISYCLRDVFYKVNSNKLNQKLKLRIGSTVGIDLKILEGATDNAKKFLCEPSNSCYTTEKDQVTIDASIHDKRYGGGHIHLGDLDTRFREVFRDKPVELVKALDILVGNMSVLLDRDPASSVRRQLYGKPGEYRRPAPLGTRLEYRVLSNFWLKSPVYMYFVFGMARAAANLVLNNREEELFGIVDFDLVREAISENNFVKAWATAEEVLKWFPTVFRSREEPLAPLHAQSQRKIFKWMISTPEVEPLISSHDEGIINYWNYAGAGWERFCSRIRRGDHAHISQYLPEEKQYHNWKAAHLKERLNIEKSR